MEETPTSRAERRRRTEERILSAARTVFAERGFERATIRAIASMAEVDPALVMQYFGSKQELFDQAVRIPAIPPLNGALDELVEELLARVVIKIGPIPQASLAMMRSMLTHPEAAEGVRARLDEQVGQLGAAIPARDAELRAALMISTMLGVTIAHQLLDLTALRDVPADRLAKIVRPALVALTGPDAAAEES
ncbi:TetR family transcriptional regulator [Microbispora corallina]|uniref:TetR family transcriptional regulator n=1 Tax=Microbispora corallina TaxID=83302 RepID=A0ABQ4FVP3_9ACTN|nr:TetR/AcrR family transcriptional regulator [Microbispora corallina]GIH38852.1 TetR family transcriptional regulator [Microbispora corallina]